MIVGKIELDAKLEDLKELDLTQVLRKCADAVRKDAWSNCPEDTGNLKSSLADASRAIKMEDKYTVSVGTNVEYAPYVEIGTGIKAGLTKEGGSNLYAQYIGTGRPDWSGMYGQPFLLPALLNNETWIKEQLADAINKEVEK